MKKTGLMVCVLLLSMSVFGQYTISGNVLDNDNRPLVSATLVVQGTYAGAYTDLSGNFVIRNLKEGSYSIQVNYLGFKTQTKTIELKKDVKIEFQLQPDPFVADEVIVSAVKASEQTPTTSSTVSKETLQQINYGPDIPYLLSSMPSVVVSSDAGTGVGYTNLSIRGSDVKRINVTVNGIPVNDAESHGVYWVDLPDIASSSENIQVQRGVGTSTNGAGAFGATVNFLTTVPSKEAYATINSSYGSFNTSKNTVSAGTGLINNRFSADVRLSKLWSNGYIDRAFSDLKSYYLAGSVYGKTSLLKFVTFSGVEHTYQAWSGVPSDSLKTNRTFNPYTYSNQTDNYWQDNYQLLYSKEINRTFTLNLALHYTRGKGYYENLESGMSYSDYGLPSFILGSDTVSKSDFITQKWLDNHFFGCTYSLDYKNKGFSSILGGAWNRYVGYHYGDVIKAQQITWAGDKFRWYKGTGDKRDVTVFSKNSFLLNGNINLFLDLQIRSIHYDINGKDDNLNEVNQVHDYLFFNPKVGVNMEIDDRNRAYLSFGIAQREPDRSNFTDADSGKIPKPERLNDFELGYEFHGSSMFLKSNIFLMDYYNQLILTGEINSVGAPVMTNVEHSYREGIEIEGAFHFQKIFTWNANLMLSRNIISKEVNHVDNWDTGIQSDSILKNITISFSPSVVFNSCLRVEPLKKFSISLVSKYVGKQYTDNTNNSDCVNKLYIDRSKPNNRILNAYFVHSLSVDYSLQTGLLKEVILHAGVNNLFNKKYETNAWVYSYIVNGKFSTMDGYFPQATRNFVAGILIKF